MAGSSEATAPGARIFGTMYREADGPWEMRRAVREQIRRGADYLKIMATGARSVEREDPEPAQMTREEVAAVVDEAHRMGFRVAAHAEGLDGARMAIEEGVDTIEHGLSSTARPSSSTGWRSAGSSSSRRCRRSTTSPSASPTTSRPALVDQAKRQADEAQRTLVAARPPGSCWRWATTAVRPVRAPTSWSGWSRRAWGPPRRSWRRRPAPRRRSAWPTTAARSSRQAADLVVVDGDPLADPAILLDPARIVLVFKDGRIVAGEGAGQPPEIHA